MGNPIYNWCKSRGWPETERRDNMSNKWAVISETINGFVDCDFYATEAEADASADEINEQAAREAYAETSNARMNNDTYDEALKYNSSLYDSMIDVAHNKNIVTAESVRTDTYDGPFMDEVLERTE